MLRSHFESQLRSCRSTSLAYPSAYPHVTSPHVTPGIANWRLIRKRRRRSKRGRKKQETAIIICYRRQNILSLRPNPNYLKPSQHYYCPLRQPKICNIPPPPPISVKKWVDPSRRRSMRSSLWAQAQSVSFSVWVWLERGLRCWFSKPRKRLFQVQELWCKSAILFIHSFVFFILFEIRFKRAAGIMERH